MLKGEMVEEEENWRDVVEEPVAESWLAGSPGNTSTSGRLGVRQLGRSLDHRDSLPEGFQGRCLIHNARPPYRLSFQRKEK